MTDTAGQCGLNIDDRASGFGVNIKGTDILLSALNKLEIIQYVVRTVFTKVSRKEVHVALFRNQRVLQRKNHLDIGRCGYVLLLHS